MKRAANFSGRIRAYRYQILLFAILLMTIGVIYGNDLSILLNEALQNEACNYILLLPFFAAFLFYLKKDVVKATIRIEKQKKNANIKYFNELSGIVLCLIAFMIYWYGSYTFYPLEIHLLSLPIFIMGAILFLSNIQTLRVLLFPVLFLFFIVPIPSSIVYTAGGALANFNTQIAYTVLKGAGLPINLTTSYGAPTIILTTAAGQPANFSVDVACSGIYSLVAFTMFGVFLAFLLSGKIMKKLAVFVLGLFTFAALNLVRITTIFSISYVFGEETAIIVHSFAGVVLLLAGMLLILLISDKLFKNKIMTKPQLQPPCPACKTLQQHAKDFCKNCGRLIVNKTPSVSKTTLGKMLLLLVCCVIAVQSVQAPTFATAKNTLELSSTSDQQNSTSVLPQIPDYSLSFIYRDVEYEKVAGQDASLMYAYFPANASHPVIFADIGVASTISNLHNWEECLISLQTARGQFPSVTQLESKEITLLQNPALTAQYLVFKEPSPKNTTQLTVYWYEKVPFKYDLITQQKYVRISLIILTEDSTGYQKYEPQLIAAAQLIAEAWEPLKNQAILSLGVPAQQALLVVLIVFLVSTQTAAYFSQQRKRSNMFKIFDNYASVKEKIVFNVILQLSEGNKNVRTMDIVTGVEAKVEKPVNANTVLSVLRRLEGEGFVHRAVASIGNSPVLVWRILSLF
jgi:exosortase